jgi:hypothetical protein
MVLAQPWASLAAVSRWNHPAEQPITQAIVFLLTFLGKVRIPSVATTTTISAATTVTGILTGITTVTPATIHAIRVTTVIAGVAVHRRVAASHVAVARMHIPP